MNAMRWRILALGICLGVLVSAALTVAIWPAPADPQAGAVQAENEESGGKSEKPPEPTPEEKMARRHPQKVRVGDLVGQPVLDESDRVLGRVRKVVRTGDGKLQLVTSYGGIFGFGQRFVAVPVEVVALLGLQVAAVDWPLEKFELAPTWFGSDTTDLESDEVIRLAVTRR
jgi:hypothetical protein